MRHFCLILCLTFSLTIPGRTQNAIFEITTNISTPELDAAMAYATDIWSEYLISDVPIKINVTFFTNIVPPFLGLCVPNCRRGFAGAPYPEYWYPTSLANAIIGEDVAPLHSDMDIFMPYLGIVDWNLDPNFVATPDSPDFISIFLHEIAHGLGFLSMANRQNGLGSFGMISASEYAPYSSSFPIPDFDDAPSVYDFYLVDDNGLSLINDFSNNSGILGGVFTSSAIFFDGEKALSANGNIPIPIWAPQNFALGSSLSHLDEDEFPIGDENALMTPGIFADLEETRNPGPIAIGILEDIGWNVIVSQTEEKALSIPNWYAYSDGAQINVVIQDLPLERVQIQLFDFTGRLIDQKTIDTINTDLVTIGTHLQAGQYVIRLVSRGQQSSRKVFCAP